MSKACFLKINIYITVLFAILILDACTKDDPSWNLEKTLPKPETSFVTDIKSTSATAVIKIIHNGGSEILEKGVCFALTPNPTVQNSTNLIIQQDGPLSFFKLNNLEPDKTYYIRAFAKNKKGIGYGNEISFLSGSCFPSITTNSITNLTSTSALCGGTIVSDGGVNITAKGIVWSTSQNPTISLSTKTNVGNGSASFTSQITGLTANTVYFVRAYCTNSCSTVYGSEVSFTTLSCNPSVTTSGITNITSNSALSGGASISNGGVSITAKGIVWSTSQNPTISLSTKTNDGSGSANYSSQITGLIANTRYYVRAYVTNNCSTSYGQELSFVSGTCIPSVTTNTISNITSTSATSGGVILSNGGVNITSKGVVWSTSQSPTVSLSTKTNNGSGTGDFSSSITGLSPNTIYYVRAYATNSCGTVYGSQINFTTTSNTLFTGTINIGSGTNSETSNGEPAVTPFGTLYTDGRHVYLIKASEITNLGGKSGNIESISFNIVNRANISLNNFTIKLGTTSLNEFAIVSPSLIYTNTYNFPSFNLANLQSGWVEFTFNSSFFWNGSQNIFIEVCFDNSSYAQNTTVQYSQTSFYSNLFDFRDNASGCSLNWEFYSDYRPNIRLNFK